MSTSENDILILQTAFLGDLLLGIPMFKRLRRLYPHARLVLFCRQGLGSFFLEARLVDEVIEVDKSSSDSWRSAREKVLSRDYQLLLSPHESFRTAWLAKDVRAKRKIGYRRWFNHFIFQGRVRRPMELPEALRQLALLSELDSSIAPAIEEFTRRQTKAGGQTVDGLAAVPPATDMVVAEFLSAARAATKSQKPLAVLAPGSVWRTKMWTQEGFAEVGRELSKRGYDIVVMGSRDEAQLCESIAQAVPGAKSIAGTSSLSASARLLAGAAVFVGNDSGAMHLAATAGTPTVSVFGPTVLDFGYRPWNSRSRVVQTEMKCRPCGAHGAKECPIGTHACMRDISAKAVLKAVDEVIEQKN